MTVAMPMINPNQQEQSNVVGQLDLQANRGAGVLSGLISPNAGGPIQVGSAVKLDTSNTTKTPWFLACAASDVAFGRLVFTEKNASPAPGDAVEVAYLGGPVLWVVADETIHPGDLVEDGDDGPMYVSVLDAGKQRGLALDYGVAGSLVRVITYPSLT